MIDVLSSCIKKLMGVGRFLWIGVQSDVQNAPARGEIYAVSFSSSGKMAVTAGLELC